MVSHDPLSLKVFSVILFLSLFTKDFLLTLVKAISFKGLFQVIQLIVFQHPLWILQPYALFISKNPAFVVANHAKKAFCLVIKTATILPFLLASRGLVSHLHLWYLATNCSTLSILSLAPHFHIRMPSVFLRLIWSCYLFIGPSLSLYSFVILHPNSVSQLLGYRPLTFSILRLSFLQSLKINDEILLLFSAAFSFTANHSSILLLFHSLGLMVAGFFNWEIFIAPNQVLHPESLLVYLHNHFLFPCSSLSPLFTRIHHFEASSSLLHTLPTDLQVLLLAIASSYSQLLGPSVQPCINCGNAHSILQLTPPTLLTAGYLKWVS